MSQSEKNIMCLAVIYNGYQAYLVQSDMYQNDNDIEITEEQYEYLLDVNNNKQAEIRVIELDDGSLAVKDFYDPLPSFFHRWNRKTQKWEISKEDEERLITQQNIAFLESEEQRTEDALKKLQRVVDRKIATDEELTQFDELELYSILLMRVPNQPNWPLIVEWPEQPEFFKTKE